MTFSFEVTGAEQFQRRLGEIRKNVPENVEQAVEVTLRNIKDDARAGASRLGKSAKRVAVSIAYRKPHRTLAGVDGEVGYRKGWRQAGLPLEVGTRHTAPKPVLREALEKNREDFFKGIGKAIEDAL